MERKLEPKVKDESIDTVANALKNEDDFLLCGHIRPDGDCIGSQLGLYHLLKQMGKRVAMLNTGLILAHYEFLPGIKEIRTEEPRDWKPRVYVFVDCSEPNRVRDNFSPQGVIINIDHHNSNTHFGDINYVNPEAAAVGEQIYNVLKRLEMIITPEIATCIYLAILADTGSFRFSNTTAQMFRIVAELVEAGADASRIAQEFYENNKLESVKLTCGVLCNLNIESDGKLAWSEITQKTYRSTGGECNEPEGLVNTIRGVHGVEIALLIHEIPEGGLRVSFRSKGRYDVSQIAKQLGGGGHLNAAGCYLRGDYEQLKANVLNTAREYLKRNKEGV
jgi:phosphoesterase RecJ-like protein